jgi:hypothetical protein
MSPSGTSSRVKPSWLWLKLRMVIRADHSYEPKGSADWKFTLGSFSTSFRGLAPGISRDSSSPETVCTWRVSPRPRTTISSTELSPASAAAVATAAPVGASAAAADAAMAKLRAAVAAPVSIRDLIGGAPLAQGRHSRPRTPVR